MCALVRFALCLVLGAAVGLDELANVDAREALEGGEEFESILRLCESVSWIGAAVNLLDDDDAGIDRVVDETQMNPDVPRPGGEVASGKVVNGGLIVAPNV